MICVWFAVLLGMAFLYWALQFDARATVAEKSFDALSIAVKLLQCPAIERDSASPSQRDQ